MRRIIIIAITLLCFFNIALAQEKMLIVEGISPNLYVTHTIAPKENYYSIGRIYNVAPKEIAAYNNLVFESGLNVGQTIKIPLTAGNFIQTENAANTKLLIPLYHVVEAKEGLYRISQNHNKISPEQLKKWNSLSSDAVSSGTNLIIGYLKIDNESPLSKNSAHKENTETVSEKSLVKENSDTPKTIAPEQQNSVTIKPAETETSNAPLQTSQKPQEQNNSATSIAANFNGGAFKKIYEAQHGSKTPVTESGLSGVFKSTSGWRDGKYYCFHNSAPAGTIVKVTNSVNGKSVYAKVLDLIPDINQNAGLVLHISNAAANELGVNGTRFDCSINFSK
jgi:LysM repeat protein